MVRSWALGAAVGFIGFVLVMALFETPLGYIAYPRPPAMPEVVAESMEELLARYEAVLEAHSPQSLAALQPGLTEEEIARLEEMYDAPLTEDMRTLYMWRNGMSNYAGDVWSLTPEFLPGYFFIPLEEALRMREELRGVVGFADSWVPVFEDGAGDGYYYDPNRRETGGWFFFNFLEDGWYTFYPSVRNVIAHYLDGFESGIFEGRSDGTFDEDFERSHDELWDRYGATKHW